MPRVPEPLGYLLFGLAGDLVYLLAGGTRAMMLANLRRAMPAGTGEARLSDLTRQAFRNLLFTYYEIFHLPAYTLDDLKRRVRVDGDDLLAPVPGGGKG